MSGEVRMVRSALVWVLAAAVPAAGVAAVVRGTPGLVSVLCAVAIVLANAVAAAAASALAARLSPSAPAMLALPSFTFRMLVIFLVLNALKGASFIDDPTFALAFGAGVAGVLVLEARSWKRTPWLALTLEQKRTPEATTVEETA